MFKKEITQKIIRVTRYWLEQVIIGLNLCPFAKAPYLENKVRVVVTDAANARTLADVFMAEIKYLDAHPNKETTLLVVPAIQNVNDFHAVYMNCELILLQKKLTEVYQIVSFHPLARVSGHPPDSPLNLVMMAPYPIIHILRTESVEKLGSKIRQDIQLVNSNRLANMTKEEFTSIWQNILQAEC
ncbi:MAG: DUF1415 domain-containing protein [Bernardetiaceae bacterium]|nr:DUF1415 domain-containing protein [Bernardetiaceae bacterium]